ncbi:CENP-B protein 1 [Apiotrichum porosum]|uniref:Glucanase n=2 Tax=Fungi TaxID=4751 RepID=A0A427YAX8_9TREE|nr:CENP-B protein 1 [Apiotrichum porosum]RSH88301.1 CENP-B protein 1 [Apiotrichum porosum]
MIPAFKLLPLVALLGSTITLAQQACTSTTETHPSLTWQTCTSSGSCTTNNGAVTVDANWRWTHTVSGSTNCYTGNTWNSAYCPDGTTCAAQCCVDGADYSGTYGVTSSSDALTLKFVTNGPYSTNIGSRLYLMASETQYQMFNLLGNEFTFDVDVSNLGCGLNGALYFVAMDADGGLSKYSGNKAGAKFGTGYCDAQCPRDVKFINGVANVDGWTPSTNDANSGVGNTGTCCAEMDIWEANSLSTAYTAHPCTNNAQHSCSGDNCGGTYSSTRYAGDCDPDGCDYNSYRQGNTTFYGPGSGFALDTTKKLSVVTQFITDSAGALSDIKRFYVQNGVVVPNSETSMAGTSGNSITSDYCTAQKVTTGDTDVFAAKGGLAQMGKALSTGMVLVLSLWDDHAADMLWLDSTYPVGSTAPGAARGSCSSTSGVPATLESTVPNSSVVFSGIKFGPIGSTFNSGSTSSSSAASSTKASSTAASSTKASSSTAASSTVVTSTKASSSSAPGTSTTVEELVSSAASAVVSSATEVASSSAASSVSEVATSASSAAVSSAVEELDSCSSSAAATSSSASGCTVTKWGQCGGASYTGCTTCVSGSTCTYQNDWYSQCL